MAKQQSIPKLKKKAQKIFNEFIRKRDEDKPCISCGEPKPYKQAGHFFSTKLYDSLRLNEYNCNGECPDCNLFDPDHLIHYEENLKNRIGEKAYEELKLKAEDYKMNGYKWSRSELLEIIETYKNKLKELEK